MCLVLAVSLSSHQISEKGPRCTRWIFVYFANMFFISSIKCTLIFFLPKFCQCTKFQKHCRRASEQGKFLSSVKTGRFYNWKVFTWRKKYTKSVWFGFFKIDTWLTLKVIKCFGVLSSCVITCTLEETKSVDIFGRTKQIFSNLVQTVPAWIFSVRIFVGLVTLPVFRIQVTLVIKMFCRIEYYILCCPGTLTLCRQKFNISNICKRNSSPLVVSSSCTFPQQILNHYIGTRWFR